ncbi:MAG TPA: phosphotransferase [Vicinamibacterales bacterium]|jgi:thiamine kinase-like enzyme
MIEGLDRLLDNSGQPGVTELRSLLEELLGGREAVGRLIEHETLQPRGLRMFRLRFGVSERIVTVVVKRLRPAIGRRTELVARRWMPAVGLSDSGPPLLGSAAERGGNYVWHVYDDLGRHELDRCQDDRKRIGTAVELIASVHTRFAKHPLLGEVRMHGGDLGIRSYESNVNDAVYALDACRGDAQHDRLRNRLLQRLYTLRQELARRAHMLDECGGPETLLHGDLWPINVFVIPNAAGFHGRLIDWDHVGVGPASYDLSTFLSRLPRQHRTWAMNAYREHTARAGWSLPSVPELNFLFETAEYARYANRVIWPAIALVHDHAAWGWEMLAEVDTWFEHLEPVLPLEHERRNANLAHR